MAQYTLKYRRFDQVLSDVSVDLPNYTLENMIEPSTLLKVAKKCNAYLGLKIYKTKEVILDVENGFVRLPDDFYVFNSALICDKHEVTTILPQGVHIEHVELFPKYKSIPDNISTCDLNVCTSCTKPLNDCGCPKACDTTSPCADLTSTDTYGDPCITPRVFIDCKNNCTEIVQIVKAEKRSYRDIRPLRLRNNGAPINPDCFNLRVRCNDEAWIENNFLYTSFKCGKVYLSYEGMLEDDEGNLLVPDHDLLNDYYEYAIKEKIFENLLLNDENVVNKLQLVISKLGPARKIAMSLVNMPDFKEMQNTWRANRIAQYQKYYRQFQSFSWYTHDINLARNRGLR